MPPNSIFPSNPIDNPLSASATDHTQIKAIPSHLHRVLGIVPVTI